MAEKTKDEKLFDDSITLLQEELAIMGDCNGLCDINIVQAIAFLKKGEFKVEVLDLFIELDKSHSFMKKFTERIKRYEEILERILDFFDEPIP